MKTHDEARQRLQDLAAHDAFRHALPAECGGLDDGFADLYRAHRCLGRDSLDPGLLLALNAHLWGAVFALYRYGSAAQHQQWLPHLLDGRWLGGHAITEAHAGSDVQAMRCQAQSVADGYLLNGEKCYITNAPIADALVLYAKLDGKISAFWLLRDDAGCRFGDDSPLQVCRGSTTGTVELRDCRLPPDRLLGKPGAGAAMIQNVLELERAFVFAGIAGVMEWQLKEVVQRSRQRRSGERHLGAHQAISHKIADMKLRLDTLDLWLRHCADLCDRKQRISLVSAQTKLFAAEAFLQSSLDAVQIFGASGLSPDNRLLSLVGDAMAGRLFSGSSEVQKNLIAALLGTGSGFAG